MGNILSQDQEPDERELEKPFPYTVDYQPSCRPACQPSPKEYFRTTFSSSHGTSVTGWPSTGGIYTLDDCDGVELEFLHLDRFTRTPRSDSPTEEDTHCAHMRKLGAKWWKSSHQKFLAEYPDFADAYGDLTDYGHLAEYLDKVVVVGWPGTGGVWVLAMSRREAERGGVGRVKNAFSMEERCGVIEQLGGVFYADPMECPDLDLEGRSAAGKDANLPRDEVEKYLNICGTMDSDI